MKLHRSYRPGRARGASDLAIVAGAVAVLALVLAGWASFGVGSAGAEAPLTAAGDAGTGSGDGIETDHFGSGSGDGSDFGSGEHEHYGTGSGDEMDVEAIPGDMP